jgi:hypothetical protein
MITTVACGFMLSCARRGGCRQSCQNACSEDDETAVDGATVGADLIQEPLTKADRLELSMYVRKVRHCSRRTKSSLKLRTQFRLPRRTSSPDTGMIPTPQTRQPLNLGKRSLSGKLRLPQISEAAKLRIVPSQASRSSAVIGPPHSLAS